MTFLPYFFSDSRRSAGFIFMTFAVFNVLPSVISQLRWHGVKLQLF